MAWPSTVTEPLLVTASDLKGSNLWPSAFSGFSAPPSALRSCGGSAATASVKHAARATVSSRRLVNGWRLMALPLLGPDAERESLAERAWPRITGAGVGYNRLLWRRSGDDGVNAG